MKFFLFDSLYQKKMRLLNIFSETLKLGSYIKNLNSSNQNALLGRWRYVGSQKNGIDILEIKMKNKQKRHQEKVSLN